MSLSRPSAVLTLDGRSLDAARASLASLQVRLCLGSAHDSVELALAPGSRLASSKAGADPRGSAGEKGSEGRFLPASSSP